MIRLINDMLDIKKIAANKLVLKLQLLRPVDLINSVVAPLVGMAKECQIELIQTINDDRAFRGDRDRLIQVLANLVSNAIKFSAPCSRVVLGADMAQDGSVRFSVQDSGPGIAEADFDKLFIAFQQLDSSDARAKGGTGLGLAISKAIVERHGGKIGFTTDLGKGATFWFELPLRGPAGVGNVSGEAQQITQPLPVQREPSRDP